MSVNKSEKYSPLSFRSLFKRLIPSRRILRLWTIQLKILVVAYVIVLIIVACLMLMNNTIRTPPEPLEYKVIEFSACRGWNEVGAAERQQVFQSVETRVFACGRIQANRPVTLSVYWRYKDQYIYRDIIKDVENKFLSELQPTEKEFPVGDYELQLVIGREIEGHSEFKVTPP